MRHVCEVLGSKSPWGLEAYPRQHYSSLDIGVFAFGTGADVPEALNYLSTLDAGIDRNADLTDVATAGRADSCSGNEIFVPLLDRSNEVKARQADTIERALQPRCVAALVEPLDADDDANTNARWLHAA